MGAHLAAAGDKAQKRAFFEHFKLDKKCRFECEVVEKKAYAVSDSAAVVEGWMSQPGS